MQKHTDSVVVHWNEDGSRTVETVETVYPATRAQQIAAWGTLVGISVLPLVPLAVITIQEKREERRARKAAKKSETED